ncbi:streptavidin-V2-like isoform X2 [Apostichopus japonicus]|uniref:streptavidin-V2-like isoform X2 n=1 Tax=Stichopus japonicus TaxID=307972 RepID=UPI003AB7A4F8
METRTILIIITLCGLCLSSLSSETVNYNGTWHNQLGSYMEVTSTSTGSLQGQYYTALVRTGSGAIPGVPLVGFVATDGTNSTIGFVGSWFNSTVVTWNGEYKICQDVPVIFTSWIMKTVTTSCLESPLSTRIGQDCFTRFRQLPLEDGECEQTQPRNPCNTPC